MIDFNINNTSPTARLNAKVELYEGSTLVETCTCNDRLQEIVVERIGLNNKFFGFGIIHKLSVKLIDLERNLTVTKNNSLKVYFGYDTFISPYPTFYVAEVTRDESTNTITVVAYDKLYSANEHTVSEVTAPYTLHEFVAAAVPLLGVANVVFEGVNDNAFSTNYPTGGNFEGTENYREALNAAAEATQTIYFLNNNEQLVFKRLDRGGSPVLTITKNDYYELDSGETRVLAAITNTNELGDSTSVEVDGITGVVQYVRNNPFWELREDIQLLLAHAGSAIGGIAATPFYCDWDGNFLLEVGDKIALTAEDNSIITSYVLYDTIRYDGILAEATQFIHDGTEETASNPLSLGEALKQTYAKVDKQNKTIELVASETASNSANIASMKIDVDGIKLAIESLEDATLGDFTDLTKRIAALELSDTEIKASVQETTQTVEAIEGDIESLTTELGTTEATLGALQGTVSTHTTKISELTTTANSINAQVSSLESKTTTIEGDLQTLDDSINTLGENVMDNNETIAINKENIAALQIATDGISASVSSFTETTQTQLDNLEENYQSLREEVSLKITKDDLNIAIEKERANGAESVKTSTGFTFNENGLTIEKSDSNLSTNIDENGLSVYKYNEEVLTADNEGVKAQNLHATTYLIIGANTYIKDFTDNNGNNRAGCFWNGD